MHADSFFSQALVYLSVAVLCVPIARALGLGSVLGYLIGGVVIGPSVLGWVGEESQDVMHFAEIGVVMMLFLIGLELDPGRLWRMRKPILGLGGTQVVVTSLVLTGIAWLVGLPWNQAAAVGMTLSLSSTAIVLQTLNEKRQLKTSGGQSAFSVLLFQDISIVPMLSILPLLAVGGVRAMDSGDHELLIDRVPEVWKAPVVLVVMTVIVLAGRFLSRYLFRFIARSGLREVFTAAALLLIVATAVLMKGLGLSPALGAFLAGVVLANNEYRHELETNLEPFKGLFLGLFFIAVGTSIDFALFTEQPLTMSATVLGLVLVKLVLLLGLGKVFGLSTEQNRLFGSSLAQGSEFAFVLLSFAATSLVIPTTLANMLMGVVAVSMALSPLLMLLNDRWAKRAVADAGADQRPPDEIHTSNPVVIAGFGRFGQIVGRFLRANGVEATVLDVDSDSVELLRQLGLTVYYGDASREDVLDAAGADSAKLIVVAVAEREKSLEIVRTVQKHYPDLAIFARACTRTHAYDLLDAGVEHVYLETLDSSLELSIDALRGLGVRAYRARRAARRFRHKEDQDLRELNRMRHDEKAYMDLARTRIRDIETLLRKDLGETNQPADDAWDLASAMRRVTSRPDPAPAADPVDAPSSAPASDASASPPRDE